LFIHFHPAKPLFFFPFHHTVISIFIETIYTNPTVDAYNQLDKAFFTKLGIFSNTEKYKLTDFIGATILKVIPNDAFYTMTEDGLFVPASVSQYDALYSNGEGIELTITGILRIKEDSVSIIDYLSPGLVYTTTLTDYIVTNAQQSGIAIAQLNSDTNVILNTPFTEDDTKNDALLRLGAVTTPTGINIYPRNFADKNARLCTLSIRKARHDSEQQY